MLRFPNPGSDVSGYIRIFHALHGDLEASQPFSLDDMTTVMVGRNLATSSGYMGQEALERSTRANRSLDPFYNQSKAYSELYRILGWIHPQPNNKLLFSFTYLGAHAANAQRDPKTFFQECLLRITYPNPLVEVKGAFRLRPFACILRTLLMMDDKLTRDEMIVGPLSLKNDQDEKEFDQMIKRLRAIRGKPKLLANAIAKVSQIRNITTTTMGNYTRLPMAALPWVGWTTKPRLKLYGVPTKTHVLTEQGKLRAREVTKALDFRATDIAKLKPRVAEAFIKLSLYSMLERGGFDVAAMAREMQEWQKVCAIAFPVLHSQHAPISLFSPFQEILYPELQMFFPSTHTRSDQTRDRVPRKSIPGSNVRTEMRLPLAQVAVGFSTGVVNMSGSERVKALAEDFHRAYRKYDNTLSLVTDHFMGVYRKSSQQEFYPLVADLFCLIGFQCEASRAGVNYQRADAFITDEHKSIPIEIKSPTEELNISIKAVRQALENKIILLSRQAAPTEFATSSLVVGYLPPNKRAEVESLISDIRKAFDIRIGVIDFRSLLTLAAAGILEGTITEKSQLESLCGLLHVSAT